ERRLTWLYTARQPNDRPGVIPETGSHRKVLLPILAIADHTRQAVACREPWIRLPDDFARTFPPGFFD
ncbi:hypothetical protein, partial [Rivihabitans pingtungensis]|uniref:hypothetical protein n=1 Tax=Rivihabitans pingtungensis TaxID=1054498 RepID=UPI002BAF0A6A